MNRRSQWSLAILLLSILALLIGRELGNEESLLGPRGERRNEAVPFQAQDVPLVVLASPGARPGETFDRERVDIFRYEEAPSDREARRRAEQERLEAERRKREAEAERARIDKARRDAEEAERLKREAEQRRLDALRRLQEAQEAEPTEVVVELKPEPPDFPYRFDGLIGPKSDAIAILRDSADDYAYARAGQVLDEAFRIERVGQLKLVLSFTDPQFAGEFRQVPLRLDAVPAGQPPSVRPTALR